MREIYSILLPLFSKYFGNRRDETGRFCPNARRSDTWISVPLFAKLGATISRQRITRLWRTCSPKAARKRRLLRAHISVACATEIHPLSRRVHARHSASSVPDECPGFSGAPSCTSHVKLPSP